MEEYDPHGEPDAQDWLERDEGERIEAVVLYHRSNRIPLPNVRLHSVIHVVIENQLALGLPVVLDTMARLREQGLDRHEALHAIGSVAAEYLLHLLKGETPKTERDTSGQYYDRLRSLTADAWLQSGSQG